MEKLRKLTETGFYAILLLCIGAIFIALLVILIGFLATHGWSWPTIGAWVGGLGSAGAALGALKIAHSAHKNNWEIALHSKVLEARSNYLEQLRACVSAPHLINQLNEVVSLAFNDSLVKAIDDYGYTCFKMPYGEIDFGVYVDGSQCVNDYITSIFGISELNPHYSDNDSTAPLTLEKLVKLNKQPYFTEFKVELMTQLSTMNLTLQEYKRYGGSDHLLANVINSLFIHLEMISALGSTDLAEMVEKIYAIGGCAFQDSRLRAFSLKNLYVASELNDIELLE